MGVVIAKRLNAAFWILMTVVMPSRHLGAERLAVHTYTVAEGLAGDQVTVIVQDRQGFLWIGTRTGLSRFDGVGFRSFDTRDGLPDAGVFAILESSGGDLWIGTGEGLVRMRNERATGGSAFEPVAGLADAVVALAEDREGRLWASSAGSLYLLDPTAGGILVEVETDLPWLPDRGRAIAVLAADNEGGLWLGSSVGLFRRLPDGTVVPHGFDGDDRPQRIYALLLDAADRIWVTGRAVTVFKPEPTPGSRTPVTLPRPRRYSFGAHPALPTDSGVAIRLETDDESTNNVVFDLDQGPDGAVWMASHWGLSIVGVDRTTTHGRRTGLVSNHLSAVLVDEAGNAWIGTDAHGLMRINSTGFTSYTEDDGLIDRRVASVTLGPSGEAVAVTLPPEGTIHIPDGERFLPLGIPLPDLGPLPGWGLNQVTFFDHDGKLWVPTPRGLFRFPRLEDLRDLPRRRHERRFLPDDEIYRIFEDSRGDLWIGGFDETRLARWERATDTIHHYGPEHGIPFQAGTAFAEDASGAVWIGFYTGGLARWLDGGFEFFDQDDGVPRGMVNCLLRDHRGRIWVGAHTDGLAVVDEPTAAVPGWRRFTVSDGLASDGIFSLAEDGYGRIYAGSLKGVDRLDPDTGRVEHFDTSTGLVNNLVVGAVTSPGGDLWFATAGGVNHYRPSDDVHPDPPAVFIDRVTIDGADLTVPLRGVESVPRIALPSRTEVVEIGFAAVDLTPGSHLDFEISVGPGRDTWSPVGTRRFVRLAGLAPGHHNIALRARLPNGAVGPAAFVDLRIAAPLWRRWWFLAAIVAIIAVAGWLIQRLRIQRLKALHRVRSRIAADLHDEMGLSLARVAILADVAGRTTENPTTAGTLEEIGGTARDLVDAASDMAWALDPRHDTVAALAARLRRTAGEVAEGFNAAFELRTDPLDGVAMASETRRHLFLVLKEAIRNACRHGRSSRIILSIRRRPSSLAITLEDDGVGFDPDAQSDGQGLASMKRRAIEMGAELSIDSTPGCGSTIHLEIPLPARA
jgi:ligand-binding sensor domain-containing protein/signal transduction histidine kinase